MEQLEGDERKNVEVQEKKKVEVIDLCGDSYSEYIDDYEEPLTSSEDPDDDTDSLFDYRNPYEDMPTLENMMTTAQLDLRASIGRDNTAESIFVTLARYSFPGSPEILLPGISAEAIFSTCKHLVPRWTNCAEIALTTAEQEFLDSLCLKEVDAIDMPEWEQLRCIYTARDAWFARQRDTEDYNSNVTVRVLPSKTKLFPHLPPCSSPTQAKAMMFNYVSVVNLGVPVDSTSQPLPFKSMSNREENLYDDGMNNSSALRRSVRLQNRSDCIVEALQYQFNCGDDLTKVDEWPFDLEQQVDSGFDEAQVDTEVSIFQCAEIRHLAGLGDHFLYPSEQLTSDSGLTRMEEEAFEDLERQLETYYVVPRRKRYRTKAARNAEALEKGSILTKKSFSVPSSTVAKRRWSCVSGDSSRKLRSSSRTSTASELEIISEEKAILTSLRIPSEYAAIPSAKFLAEHGGQYLQEKDFVIDYDQTVPFPVDKPMTISDEGPSLLQNQHEKCVKEPCLLGCVCHSLGATVRVTRDHCGKVKCMFECICVAKTPKPSLGIRDIRLSLRSGVRKWKRPANENVAPKKRKRSSSVNADEERKRKRFGPEKTQYINTHSDGEDNYMGDIDRTETSSDEGSLKCVSPSLHKPHPEVITLDSDSDEEDDLGEFEIIEVDGSCLAEADYSQYNSLSPKEIRPTDLAKRNVEGHEVKDDDIDVVQLRWSRMISEMDEENPDSEEDEPTDRPLYSPLPLEFINAENEETTFCVVNVEESHNVLIRWREDCDLPRADASKKEIGSVSINSVLTLPFPPIDDTFYLFKLPAVTDGDIRLHMLDMRFCLPLDELERARVKGAGQSTRQIQLLTPDQERLYAAAGHPCDVYVFPDLPQLLVIGPYQTGPDEDSDLQGEYTITASAKPWSSDPPEPAPQEPTQWNNGDGDRIPTDYLEKCIDDFMIEFPAVGEWKPGFFQTKV